MSKKPDKYTKIKTAEVSSQSWLGRPSEMDRTIEKWVNKGWTLTDRENIGTSKYLLTFEYSMSEAEIAKQKKSEQRTGWGCLIIIAVLIVSGVISANQNAASKATAQTQVALLNDTQAAESHATSTAKAISDTNATATATWWTSTPTVTPSNTSTSTNTPTATATPTNTSTPTITPTATDTFTPTTTETATNTPIATMTSTPMPTSVVASVTGNNINARRCPSQSCEVVRVVTSQEALVVLGEYDDWYWVKFPDNEAAYIFGDLVRLPEGAVVALAPTMTPTQHPSATPTATRTRRPTSTPQRPSSQVGSACETKLNNLPGFFLRSTYVDSKGRYKTYTYRFLNNSDYEVFIDFSDDWDNLFRVAYFDLEGRGDTVIRSVQVSYGFDLSSEPIEVLLGFDFEYAGTKFFGGLSRQQIVDSPQLRRAMVDNLQNFVTTLIAVCEE